MPIQDYSTDPDLNVQISGINIAEGCPPSGINNAIRQLMADVKVESEAQAEAITAAGEALEAFAEGQAVKDEEQDEAIAEAKSSAEAASKDVTALDTTLRTLIAEELQKYLPLAGGQITGGLILAGQHRGVITRMTGQSAYADWNIQNSAGSPIANFRFYETDDHNSMEITPQAAAEGITWPGPTLALRYNKQTKTNNATINNNEVITLVASWSSGANWYRKYSDGWVVQGGVINQNSGNHSNQWGVVLQATLPVEMASTDFSVLVTPISATAYNAVLAKGSSSETEKTTTFIKLGAKSMIDGSVYFYGFQWEVKGYAKA